MSDTSSQQQASKISVETRRTLFDKSSYTSLRADILSYMSILNKTGWSNKNTKIISHNSSITVEEYTEMHLEEMSLKIRHLLKDSLDTLKANLYLSLSTPKYSELKDLIDSMGHSASDELHANFELGKRKSQKEEKEVNTSPIIDKVVKKTQLPKSSQTLEISIDSSSSGMSSPLMMSTLSIVDLSISSGNQGSKPRSKVRAGNFQQCNSRNRARPRR